jgi:hypothetical protein
VYDVGRWIFVSRGNDGICSQIESVHLIFYHFNYYTAKYLKWTCSSFCMDKIKTIHYLLEMSRPWQWCGDWSWSALIQIKILHSFYLLDKTIYHLLGGNFKISADWIINSADHCINGNDEMAYLGLHWL